MAEKPPETAGIEILINRLRQLRIPRGPLTDRWSAVMSRYNSPTDRAGVTSEELRVLYSDIDGQRQAKK